MFRAAMCPSSGELIVSIHLVYVTLYRWPVSVQVWMSLIQTYTPNSHLYRVSHTRCRIDTIDSPDDEWAHGCPKHVENRNKHTWIRIMGQVGYLQGLYRDARSTEHKINSIIWCSGYKSLEMITKAVHFEIPVSVMRHGLPDIVIMAVGPNERWIRVALNLVSF